MTDTTPHLDERLRRPSGVRTLTRRSSHMKLFTFRSTTHPTTPARIGKPVSSAAMEAVIDQPGPIEIRTVGADWCPRTLSLMMATSLVVRTEKGGKAPPAGFRRGLGVRGGGVVVSLT